MNKLILVVSGLVLFSVVSFGASFREVEGLAKGGDLEAQVQLGDFYYEGRGVKKHDKSAVKWYRQAAQKDYPQGLYKLGFMYENGFGLSKDINAALEFYKKAADLGQVDAKYAIGNIYLGNEDLEQAKIWFDSARGENHINAAKEFNKIEDASSKEPLQNETDNLLIKAAGDPKAMFELGEKYQQARININDAVPDFKSAIYWYELAAKNGYAPAGMRLGNIYETGENDFGIERDYAKSFYWYEQTAKENFVLAQIAVAQKYKTGRGVAQNFKDAFYWYQRAASQGDAEGEFNVGLLYEKGIGTKQNYAQAVAWYSRAANKGNLNAKFNLGHLYQMGFGVTQNYQTAFNLYLEAANLGDINAQYEVGKIYKEGLYEVPVNSTEAVRFLSRAADRGHIAAKTDLYYMYVDKSIIFGDDIVKSEGDISNEDYLSTAQKITNLRESFAVADIDKNDGFDANNLFEDTAQKGDQRALYELARIYQLGLVGVSQSNIEAFKCYLRAAQIGYAAAQFELAYIYQKASIVNVKNEKIYSLQAFHWYSQAAKQGHLNSQFNLAKIYEHGAVGVPVNIKEAMSWYLKASVAKNEIGNQALIALSALQGLQAQNAQFDLKTLKAEKSKAKPAIKAIAKPKQTTKVNRPAQAADPLMAKAKSGDANAQYEIGLRFYNPNLKNNKSQNFQSALDWFTQSGKQNNDKAQFALGVMYYRGHGVNVDAKKAFNLFVEAANNGNVEAQNNLYNIYLKGDAKIGIKADPKEAAKWGKVTVSLEKVDSLEPKEKLQAFDILDNISGK